ncbi:MAG TPA: serine/threonine-protein kinase [Acidimicrobiia bacterium]|nr:serine/threonine-protein kinase [Acidimicrobiia bacterium]
MEERYRLIEPLGSGGMASVHRAEDHLLGRQVAIKRLLPHLAADPGAAERFRREAQSAASLNHPGIVTIYDTGVDEAGPYIVMELIEGETLAARMADEAPLGVARVAAIVSGAAAALDHAHAHGVVHRDVKPSNLIVGGDGGVRLTDFGIAQAMEDPTLVTDSGEVMGTLAYMPPEVLTGAPATPASDVYSLGAVAYEMLTGRQPFQADNIAALLTRIRDEPAPPLGSGVPPEIASGVLRALDKDPANRHATAGALATALMAGTTLPIQGDVAPTAPIPAPAPEPVAAGEEPTRVMTVEKKRERSGRWLTWPLLLLIVLALILGLLALSPGAEVATAPATSTTTTTTSIPTTTTTPTATTSPDTPEAVALAISQILEGMEPPEFKPKEVEEVEKALEKVLQEAEEGDRDELRDSLEKAFEEVSKLPESPERQQLFDAFVRLAEAYGFTVAEVDGGGEGPGRGNDDD